MFTQLKPYIPMYTPKGSGMAIGVIDYSEDHHLLWVVAIDSTGEIWAYPNTQVRLDKNWSAERTELSEIK